VRPSPTDIRPGFLTAARKAMDYSCRWRPPRRPRTPAVGGDVTPPGEDAHMGFDAEGKQVWGAEKGGYVFRRVTVKP
jgi:hypothetical protein